MSDDAEPYLRPYAQATQRHRAGFRSLLWASEESQRARFRAIVGLCDFRGRKVLDAGCGRADFLDYLIDMGIEPASYVGIEAIGELADVARKKNRPRSAIVQADFVRQPSRLRVGAHIVVLCGSLNTFESDAFLSTIRTAYQAAEETLVFNYLSSPRLAAAEWLSWHEPAKVMAFVKGLSSDVATVADYMDGDSTVVVRKSRAGTRGQS